MLVPSVSMAQSRHDWNRREQTKNEWKNLGIGSAAVGLIGLLSKNNNLMWAGIAGTGYSAYRYEEDRKSQNSMRRQRAELYRHRVVYMDGHRYRRHDSWKHGVKYMRFERER